MSASEAFSAVATIYSIVSKVKENKDELLRLSNRIQYVLVSLEQSRAKDVIHETEYADAMSVMSHVITRTERLCQRILKRSLGDRTWNRSEIATEVNSLNQDLQNYLSVHAIQALDVMQSSQNQRFETLSASVQEISIKLAELDLRLPPQGGDSWADNILAQAQKNQAEAREEPIMMDPGLSDEDLHGVSLQALLDSAKVNGGKTSVTFEGLRKVGEYGGGPGDHAITRDIQVNTSYTEVLQLISAEGYRTPDSLTAQLRIRVVKGDSCYDAMSPDGLQISSTEPLRWWYNKYTEYHGIAPASTPGQTLADIDGQHGGIRVGGIHLGFHRTLRVPDDDRRTASSLPPDLGLYPLFPVSRLHQNRVPVEIRTKGGFIMPMFQKEALWISFGYPQWPRPDTAVKISAGGVNVISGIHTKEITPLTAKQDYITTRLQRRLDGFVAGPGTVRQGSCQFVGTEMGRGYTIEEQVTGKAEEGGFQFDIFPARPNPGFFRVGPNEFNLDDKKTPQELGIPVESVLSYQNPRIPPVLVWEASQWTAFVSCSATFRAGYYFYTLDEPLFPTPIRPIRRGEFNSDKFKMLSWGVSAGGKIFQPLQWPEVPTQHLVSKHPLTSDLGIAVGGAISQYTPEDHSSTRIYNEERGHRLYIHIVSPELWKSITGTPVPITPITRAMYHQHNIPWFPSYEDTTAVVESGASSVLATVKSIAELDKERAGIIGGVGGQLHSSEPSGPARWHQEVINFGLDRVSPLQKLGSALANLGKRKASNDGEPGPSRRRKYQ